ncbi:MAG TPA: methyl-accepting chemotaxis protein, partial [Pantoea sp.]|nr:methyl-accepting chemotaxis protein [Pantoea sp.]
MLQKQIDTRRHAQFMLLAGLLAVALVAIFMALMISRSVTRPLQDAVRLASQVAAGDLTSTLHIGGSNEMAELLHALMKMQQHLARLVSDIKSHAATIATSSEEIAQGNGDLSSRTEEQAASLAQTAASMEQLTATVRLNAANAQQANKLASSVSDSADRGAEVVSYVMEKMQEITASANRIGDILGVIDGIAFQTNILALNASVEAARAGEQGRGFAVVANEVRTLAQRSANAAKEIRGLISESQTRVKEGSDMATRAGETMDEISSEVMRVTTLMKE